MAGRPLNRLDLRRQAERAEELGLTPGARKADATGGSLRGDRTARNGVRVRARWGVFDATMKLIEAFEYSQKAEAEKKVVELNDLRRGSYFLQLIKEPVAAPGDDG